MRQIIIMFLAFIAGIISLCYYAYDSAQKEIENRALQLNKDCYTNQDIEYIIFNESQL